jgi:hypothetical protein
MKKSLVLIGSLIILVLLAWVLLARSPLSDTPPETAQEDTTATPEEAYVQEVVAEPENPVEDQIPDINPAAKTNPFGGAYKNPFE